MDSSIEYVVTKIEQAKDGPYGELVEEVAVSDDLEVVRGGAIAALIELSGVAWREWKGV